MPALGVFFSIGVGFDTRHVPALYDAQEGRQGPPLLARGAPRPRRETRHSTDGAAPGRVQRARPPRGAGAGPPPDWRARAGAPVRRRQPGPDGAGTAEGHRHRALPAVCRCVPRTRVVAWPALPSCASSCCRPARSRCHGRRWRRCLSRRGYASPRASCTSPRTGTAVPRSPTSCSSTRPRSTRTACIARSTSCSPTRRHSKRICRGAAASCCRSTTRCCSTT